MKSSYKQNNYGDVFYAIVRSQTPINCVELGVLNGYSTFYIAKALKDNGRGELNAYDLFEDYPFNHSNYEDVVSMFRLCGNVKIFKEDAYSVYKNYPKNSVDFLHVDLSNDGETIRNILDQWDDILVEKGSIVFEGGSEERDNVEWMSKYGKKSIKRELETNKLIEEKYIFGTYLKYPSLTHLIKKR